MRSSRAWAWAAWIVASEPLSTAVSHCGVLLARVWTSLGQIVGVALRVQTFPRGLYLKCKPQVIGHEDRSRNPHVPERVALARGLPMCLAAAGEASPRHWPSTDNLDTGKAMRRNISTVVIASRRPLFRLGKRES